MQQLANLLVPSFQQFALELLVFTCCTGHITLGQAQTTDVPMRPIQDTVTTGSVPAANVMAADQGQALREYSISRFTSAATQYENPQRLIIDWILQETGYEQWHGEVASMLSANRQSLRVYHKPEMQQTVSDTVQRFISSSADDSAFRIQVMSVGHPNWRAKAQGMMTSVPVQSPGVQAWLLARENGALLVADLKRRSDFREHNSPNMLVRNGHVADVTISQSQNYIRGMLQSAGAWPSYQPEMGQISEGLSVELRPLLSVDTQWIDAAIKCQLRQVEKMVPVAVEVPTATGPSQKSKTETPQVAQFEFHERFHWPSDQVLLVSLGVVPAPLVGPSTLQRIGIPTTGGAPRADLLVLVERKSGPAAQAALQAAAGRTGQYEGRY